MRYRVILGVCLCLASQFCGAGNKRCASLDECLARLPEVATLGESVSGRMDRKQQAFADRLAAFGQAAVPELVSRLGDANIRVAEVSAYALSRMDSIDDVYLPQIIAGLDRGLGWLPGALGSIHTPAAAREAVKRLMVSASAPHNQEAFAVQQSGSLAIPFIVEAARCKPSCRDEDAYILGSVLGEMPANERALAASGLVQLAAEDDASDDARRVAIEVISHLREPALNIEDQLLDLRASRLYLRDDIDQALVGIRSTRAGNILAEELAFEPSVGLLRDIAEAGRSAQDAGPAVVRLLDHKDWNIRLNAALTLGAIGFAGAQRPLERLLWQPEDVRLNYAAVVSLGRLRAATARDALDKVKAGHWYPPVRDAAARALEELSGNHVASADDQTDNSSMRWFELFHFDVAACEHLLERLRTEKSNVKLYGERNRRAIKKLAYPSAIVGYGAADEDEQRKASKDGIIIVTPANMVEHRSPIVQIPSVALRTDDGWLVGSNRGEWGGELMFIDAKQHVEQLLEVNVEDIYRLGDRYVAVTGIAHLSINNGLLLELSRSATGEWSTQPWRALPGAPATSYLLSSGELLVNVLGGGSIVVDVDGNMRMAACGAPATTRKQQN